MEKYTGFTRDELLKGIDNIPQEMKAEDRWIIYTLYWDDEKNKLCKVPVKRHTQRGFTMYGTPELIDCMSFSNAVAFLNEDLKSTYKGQTLELYGLGFYLTGSDFSCGDIDDCLVNNSLNAAAYDLVKSHPQTFVEYSVSGTGLHIWYKGKSPLPYLDEHKKQEKYKYTLNGETCYGEWYDGFSQRFIAVTGIGFNDCYKVTEQDTAAYNKFQTYFTPKTETVTTPETKTVGSLLLRRPDYNSTNTFTTDKNNDEIVTMLNSGNVRNDMQWLIELWNTVYVPKVIDGSTVDYNLAKGIAFWVDKHPQRTYDIFTQSPYYKTRKKYFEKGELVRTCKNACKAQKDTYTATPVNYSNGENASVTDDEYVPDDETLEEILSGIPPLPGIAEIDYSLGDNVCTWLDEYVQESKISSPWGYETYHLVCGLWAMNATVLGRLCSNVQGTKDTVVLNFLMVGKTSAFAKSTTARIADNLLNTIGIGGLSLIEKTTPERLANTLSGKVPDNYKSLTGATKEYADMRLAFPSQAYLFYDEFEQQLNDIMNPRGIRSELRQITKKVYDAMPFGNDTMSRALERVENPYISLLAGMTPAALKPFAKEGGELWGDGYFARFLFAVAPVNAKLSEEFEPLGYTFPEKFATQLKEWHERLGIPDTLHFLQSMFNAEDEFISVQPKKIHVPFTPDSYKCFQNYVLGLRRLANAMQLGNVDGNYTRLATAAARMAVMFASFDNCTTVEVKHWAKAQKIAEIFRAALHTLYDSVAQPQQATVGKQNEDSILNALIKKDGEATYKELMGYTHLDNKYSREQILTMLENLINAGLIEQIKGRSEKTLKFKITELGLQTS